MSHERVVSGDRPSVTVRGRSPGMASQAHGWPASQSVVRMTSPLTTSVHDALVPAVPQRRFVATTPLALRGTYAQPDDGKLMTLRHTVELLEHKVRRLEDSLNARMDQSLVSLSGLVSGIEERFESQYSETKKMFEEERKTRLYVEKESAQTVKETLECVRGCVVEFEERVYARLSSSCSDLTKMIEEEHSARMHGEKQVAQSIAELKTKTREKIESLMKHCDRCFIATHGKLSMALEKAAMEHNQQKVEIEDLKLGIVSKSSTWGRNISMDSSDSADASQSCKTIDSTTECSYKSSIAVTDTALSLDRPRAASSDLGSQLNSESLVCADCMDMKLFAKLSSRVDALNSSSYDLSQRVSTLEVDFRCELAARLGDVEASMTNFLELSSPLDLETLPQRLQAVENTLLQLRAPDRHVLISNRARESAVEVQQSQYVIASAHDTFSPIPVLGFPVAYSFQEFFECVSSCHFALEHIKRVMLQSLSRESRIFRMQGRLGDRKETLEY